MRQKIEGLNSHNILFLSQGDSRNIHFLLILKWVWITIYVPSAMAECRPRPDMEKRAEWPARGRAAVSPFPGDIVPSRRVHCVPLIWLSANFWEAPDRVLYNKIGRIYGFPAYMV